MTSATSTPAHQAAREAYLAGLCVVPPKEDGSKMPMSNWAKYQQARPEPETLRTWFKNGRQGLGTLTGAVSGNLEMLEFDDDGTYTQFKTAAVAAGLGPLIERIETGYSERTPKPGTHWFYRCDEIAGNTKLAQRPVPTGADGNPTVTVLIETRGEGGYAVLAPSRGAVHPTGRPYTVLHGSFATIARITPDERRALFNLARTFDAMPKREYSPPAMPTDQPAGERPGDDFAARATWDEVLVPHGWTRLWTAGEKTFWRRPGKEKSWSATTNYADSDLLYVFSSSTPFEPERGYGKFSAYTVLNHGGDFAAAARELGAQGYGKPAALTSAAGFACPAALGRANARIAELEATVARQEARLTMLTAEDTRKEARIASLTTEVKALEACIAHTDQTIGGSGLDIAEAIAVSAQRGDSLVMNGKTYYRAASKSAAKRRSASTLGTAAVHLQAARPDLVFFKPERIETKTFRGNVPIPYYHVPEADSQSRGAILLHLLPPPAEKKRHGGRRTIPVPPEVSQQDAPVRRETRETQKFYSLVDDRLLGVLTSTTSKDYWTSDGTALTQAEAEAYQVQLGAQPPPPPRYQPPEQQAFRLADSSPLGTSQQVQTPPAELETPPARRCKGCHLPPWRDGYCKTHHPDAWNTLLEQRRYVALEATGG